MSNFLYSCANCNHSWAVQKKLSFDDSKCPTCSSWAVDEDHNWDAHGWDYDQKN